MSENREASLPFNASAWKRWQLAAFDAALPEPEAPAPVPQEDVKLGLDRLRQAVREQAHGEGFAQGRDAGYQAGHAEGLEKGLTAGRKQGFAEGFSQGQEESRAICDREAEQLHALLASCTTSLNAIEAEVGQSLIGLAIDIAKKIVRESVRIDTDSILDAVRDIITMNEDNAGVLHISVSPADAALVEKYLSQEDAVKQWRVHADASIERGGCKARTSLGEIDATLQTRWQRVVGSLGQESPWVSP